MKTHYSLSELANATGLPVRKLRYVMDHKLVPERNWFVDDSSPGTPRKADQITGCLVIAAARLLAAGLKREVVGEMLEALGRIYESKRGNLGLPKIAEAFLGNPDCFVLYADRSHIRLIVGKQDSGWYRIGKKLTKAQDYTASVTTQVNLGEIRDLIAE